MHEGRKMPLRDENGGKQQKQHQGLYINNERTKPSHPLLKNLNNQHKPIIAGVLKLVIISM